MGKIICQCCFEEYAEKGSSLCRACQEVDEEYELYSLEELIELMDDIGENI